ncbi:MAG: 23S rRNA (adenine(2503)-C(2))-methyltransferase RlmN [Thermodesulfovibrionales bacterium]
MQRLLDLKSLSPEDVESLCREQGLPKYRAGQLLHWIYRKHATEIGQITEFSKALRSALGRVAEISSLSLLRRLTSKDGTEKYLFGLRDGLSIESVMIPDEDRLTLCVSSQAGCAMGCLFCLTGSSGLGRNLKAHEIVDQVLCANRMLGPRSITNIVLMGMGEPLANLDEVAEALRRIVSLVGISKRRITLSTSGIAPKIMELARVAPGVNLAVSLNATTDEVRSGIMPVNRKYPIAKLLDACRKYPLSPGRRITFEYVLLAGLNDADQDARRLVKLLHGIRCKVNLIPFNPHAGCGYGRPSDKRVRAFQAILVKSGLDALIRESRGQDILAACGQLRGAEISNG